ncbi:MAG: hypothetical protein ABW033_00555, partial [Acidimicrobiia bacterium]
MVARPPRAIVIRRLAIGALLLALASALAAGGAGAASAAAAERAVQPSADWIKEPHAVAMRVRPVAAGVAAKRRQPTAAQRVAVARMVAACDAAGLDGLGYVPTSGGDVAHDTGCVVRADGHSPKQRFLLDAPLVTGADIARVTLRTKAAGTAVVVVRLTPVASARLDGFAASHPDAPLAVTVDGWIMQRAAWIPTRLPSHAIELGAGERGASARGMPLDAARRLGAQLADSQSERFVRLVGATTMGVAARSTLADTDPAIVDPSAFVNQCKLSDSSEKLVVLGCYHDGHIVMLNVTRVDVEDTMIVTAAHEMLHAAYEALPWKERKRVDRLLEDAFEHLDDADLHELVAEYDRLEPGQRNTELHSLLGTQVRALPPALEQYYGRYFLRRTALVDAYETTERVFDEVEARIDAIATELEGLTSQAQALRAQVEAAAAEADRLASEINSLRNQGRIAESNDLVGAQNAAAGNANALLGQFQELHGTFDAKMAELDAARTAALDLVNAVSAVPITEE